MCQRGQPTRAQTKWRKQAAVINEIGFPRSDGCTVAVFVQGNTQNKAFKQSEAVPETSQLSMRFVSLLCTKKKRSHANSVELRLCHPVLNLGSSGCSGFYSCTVVITFNEALFSDPGAITHVSCNSFGFMTRYTQPSCFRIATLWMALFSDQ